jgi:drug/metabolite transporter (DMT)-like permease
VPVDTVGKFLALLCALFWAVAVILFRQAGQTLKPITLNLYKTLVAAFFLLLAMWIIGDALIPATAAPGDWVLVAASGVLGIAVADSLFFLCLNMLGAGLSAIVDCLYSPMVMFLSWLVLMDRLTLIQVGGAVLVITAVLAASLKTGETAVGAREIVLGILSGAAAMFLMGLGIVLMKPVLQRESVFWVAEMRQLAALAALLLFLALKKGRRELAVSLVDRRNWRYAFPGSLLGNVFSMTIWVAAFKLTDTISAAILNQTNTIFIVILASLLLKEPFTFRRLAATILGFSGSILVLLG